MPTENQPEQTQTPAITAEFIQANHPAVAEQFRKEGATAEMNRIKDVEAHALPGHTELINQLKFDGKTTGPEAAMAVLQAEKKNQASALQTFQNEAPQPAAPAAEAPASKPKVDPNLPVEERCKAEWDSNPEVRDEFATVEAFTAFKKAEESGRARIFKK